VEKTPPVINKIIITHHKLKEKLSHGQRNKKYYTITYTRNPAIEKIADLTMVSMLNTAIANFGSLLGQNCVLIYLPDGTETYGSRTMDFEGSGSV